MTRILDKHRGVVLALALFGCGEGSDSSELAPTPSPGGATTFDDRTSSAFQNPAPNLDDEALSKHLEGDVAFEATFVSAPSEVNPGLGPVFNQSACASCHVRNGRGQPVVGDGFLGSQMLLRVSLPEGDPEVPGGAVPVPELGTQLQDHAVYGTDAEVDIALTWIEKPGTFPADGQPYSLREPAFEITRPDGTPLGGEVQISPRIPPMVAGLGLLEAVTDVTLRALEDPEDIDGDGISGRLNTVWDVEEEAPAIGRFGWKASQPNLVQQAAAAYHDDMGITNPLMPSEDGESEIDRETLEAAAFYTQSLAVPRREVPDEEATEGEARFTEMGCAACHLPSLSTGDHPIAALRDQVIHPYTDLMLHNVGFGLADGRPDFEATGTEWRTPPLWGLGVTERVLGAAFYLHDGRARSLAEAILWHGGEAETSKEAFRTAPAADRNALLAFLRSL